MTAAAFSVSKQEVKAEAIPVITDSTQPGHTFNFQEYLSHLNTKSLGRIVFYADIVTSTMSLFDG
jgi:hypothetical protein